MSSTDQANLVTEQLLYGTDPTTGIVAADFVSGNRIRFYLRNEDGQKETVDEEFLAALEEMPPASGCALGLDRLVMLATGAERIDDVIWTPMTHEE